MRRAARALTVVSLLLGLVAPAAADLSLTAKAEVVKVYSASLEVDQASTIIGDDLMPKASATNITTLQTAIAQGTNVMHKFTQGIVRLHGISTTSRYVGDGSLAAGAWANDIGPAAMTCGGCTLTGLRTSLNTLASPTGCSGAPCGDAAFQAAATAASSRMTAAINLINTVNTATSFANALPVFPATTSSRPGRPFGMATTPLVASETSNIIGPHGDYTRILSVILFSTGFLRDALDAGGTQGLRYAINTGEAAYSVAEFTAFGAYFTMITQVAARQRHALMAYALIPTNATECGMSKTHLSARVASEALLSGVGTVGIPGLYSTFTTAHFSTLVTAMMTRSTAFGRFFGSLSSVNTEIGFPRGILGAWRQSDQSWWSIMEFPNRPVESLTQLRAQLRDPIDAFGPPLCPDAIAPSVTLTEPANAATVSGLVTITATAADDVVIAKVVFSIDAVPLSDVPVLAPYAITWDSASVANGSRTITATAFDAAGNSASDSVVVTVGN